MKKLLSLIMLLSAILLSAQQVPPIIIVRPNRGNPKKIEKLTISEIKTKVKIHGYLAETETTLIVYNPNSRNMEGDFYFPLPEGATVSGYALDIKGIMVDGVVVEKNKGRQVFEKIVRQGIDPGLVEWTKGNNFKTRIFPIPPKGTRTVRIKYVSEIIKKNGEYIYLLPLNYKNKISSLSIKVEVVKPTVRPSVKSGGVEGLKFKKWRDSFVAETSLKNVALINDLIIELPDVKKQAVIVEKSSDGNVYFCINDFPRIPQMGSATVPSKICVLWDASGSRENSDHTKEIEILRKLITKLSTPVEINLCVFRNRITSRKTFSANKNNIEELINFLKSVQYDGGTQMGALSALPDKDLPDYYLLFSDGVSTFGKEEVSGLKRPVYPISSSNTVNHAFLKYIAASTGGEYFNLKRQDIGIVIDSIGKGKYEYISATSQNGDVSKIVPGIPQSINGRFTVAGVLKSERGEIVVNYGIDGQIKQSRKFIVSAKNAVNGDLIRYFWAQKKLSELLMFPKKNKEAIVGLGKEFGLVTPGTSLIVLESLSQYVEHRITPPASFPDMVKQYSAKMAQLRKAKHTKKENKINYVLSLWKKRKDWWNREFKYPVNLSIEQKKKKERLLNSREVVESAPSSAETRDDVDIEVSSATPAPPRLPRALSRRARKYRVLCSMRAPGSERGNNVNDEGSEVASMSKSTISIKAWDPKTPYIKKLKAAKPEKRFAVYMLERKQYKDSPAFFLDCGDFFIKNREVDLGIQILSNIAEMELENASLLRVLAHKLYQIGKLDLSTMLFEEVLEMRPEEPQSYRDLALVLAKRAEKGGSRSRNDFRRAIELLYNVVMKQWDRFAEIEGIALMEINRLIPKAKNAGVEEIPVDPRLIKLLDVDVRIIMTWDADLTDMDLWVIDPSGEKSFYSNPLSRIGGRMSRDFTQGYGPEEYILKKAMKGDYQIKTNYYGSSAAKLIGAVTLQVDVYTNYGRKNEKHQAITIRLKNNKETINIGKIKF